MNFKKDGLNILLLIFVLARITHFFVDAMIIDVLSAVCLLTVVLLTFSKMRRSTLIVLGALLVAGVALLIIAGAKPDVWLAAILQNANVVMLLICVPLISTPFYYEDYQSELKTLAQARLRNLMSFLVLVALFSHVLAVIISVGAMLIVYDLLKPFALMYKAHDPFLKTAQRAYVASGFWSPAWASVIVYAVFPDVHWVKVIPVGIAFSVLLIGLSLMGTYIETKRYPGRYPNIAPDGDAKPDKKKLITMLALIVAMIGSIVVFNAVSGWDLMLVVTLTSFVFPVVIALILRKKDGLKSGVHKFYNISLVNVRDQVAVFTLAGFLGKALDVAGFGVLLARILPDWLKAYPPLMIITIVVVMIIPTFIGVHPAATGTALLAAIAPAVLGLSNYTFALTILFGWMMAIMIGPFSAISLLLSAATGESNFKVSVVDNWKFCLVALAVFSVLISVVGPMMG